MGELGLLIGGRYRIDRELFSGVGTRSLLVTDLRNGRPCVLRELSVAASPAAARRFETQAAILARLDYPGLPRFIDGFSEGEGEAAVRVVVTSYHPGESLERLVVKGRPLTETQALLLLRRIVPVLAYLHAFEPPLVHRGIKATGIVLGPDGRPCLTDIDYAVAEEALPSLDQAPPGPDELALAAPEVFMGGAVPASDLYALGLAVCRGMTAKDPAVLLREAAKTPLRGLLGVSEPFAAVLGRMLDPSLERRYPDARALEADLAKLAGARMTHGRVAEEPKPSREIPVARALPQAAGRAAEEPRTRRSARPLILAVGTLALIVLTVFAVRLRNQPEPATSLLVTPAPQGQGDASSPQAAAVPAIAPTLDPASAPSALAPPVPAPPADPPILAPPAAAEPAAASAASGAVAPAPAPAEPAAAALPPSPPVAASAPPADTAAVVAAGRLLLEGQPFESSESPAPQFWFRDEVKKTEVKPRVDYAAGAFSVLGLSPGRYAMSVRINLAAGNPNTFPGDLTGWEEFTLEAGGPASFDVSMRTVMHLVQPVDNGAVISGWDAPCGAGNVHPGKVVFSWEALGSGARYDVSVDRLACDRGYAAAGRVFAHSTAEPWVRLDLPPNQEGECYSFKLTANRGGRTVGIMNTHGTTGSGWDYKFSVAK